MHTLSQILTPQIVISYILASASHLRIFISQIFISDLYIVTFTFRSSYFETTSCLHTFGSSSRSRTVLSYHLQDFIMQLLLQAYNLIYVRLQNFISPLSGQPSSSNFTPPLSGQPSSHPHDIFASLHLRSSHLRFSNRRIFKSADHCIGDSYRRILNIFKSANHHISDLHILYLHICSTSAHLHISAPSILT